MRILSLISIVALSAEAAVVEAGSLRGLVLCGYQGWFRCPGDAAEAGWRHWSRDARRLVPETLTFEMWPDVREFPSEELFAAPGFTLADGRMAQLFSSDHAGTVRRHFQWMRDYGIDGVWLQHFVVELPDAPGERQYASRRRVLEHVRAAARETGRAWALTFEMTGMPVERVFEVLTREWTRLAAAGVVRDERYVHERGKPVVQLFGLYHQDAAHAMTAPVADRLIAFFKEAGVFVVGGGAWDWRRNADPAWRAMYRRLDAISPWNVGNVSRDAAGVAHATTNYWADDLRECEQHGMLWLPVIYPGFSWDHLKRLAPGTSKIDRRGGRFLWEQFVVLARLGVSSATVAMFDEVDEATAIFKVTSDPPVQARFLGFDGLPSDWYLRLVGEGTRRLRAGLPIPEEMSIQP